MAKLDVELRQILEISVRNNKVLQVTGALLAHSGAVTQVLEGRRDAIYDTYRRIQLDKRHENLRVLVLEPIEQRRFAAWAMRACDPYKIPPEAHLELSGLNIPDLLDVMERSLTA